VRLGSDAAHSTSTTQRMCAPGPRASQRARIGLDASQRRFGASPAGCASEAGSSEVSSRRLPFHRAPMHILSASPPSPMSSRPSPPSALRVILGGGALVAILDIALAMGFWHTSHGVAPARILQSVAAGLLGKDAASQGGAETAWLGALLHLGIAIGMAAVYWSAARTWPSLRRHWIAGGLGFGLVAYLVMTFVVVPLSKAGPSAFWWPWIAASVFAHLCLVGLPLAWLARSR
jgi:hypothetical protein